MKLYITFGQSHTHSVNGITLDKNIVACINGKDYEDCRNKAFEFFDGVFATSYTWEEIEKSMHYFPRGIVEIN